MMGKVHTLDVAMLEVWQECVHGLRVEVGTLSVVFEKRLRIVDEAVLDGQPDMRV